MTAPWLIDAVDLGVNPKGISRVLASLADALCDVAPEDVVFAVTPAGQPALAHLPRTRVVCVAPSLQSRWEQVGLPRLARQLGAAAIYSHREAGALWGPPLVLHVPEDPEVRWERTPPTTAKSRARQVYSRSILKAALRRAAVVGVSTSAVGDQISSRYRLPRTAIRLIPLGVDLERFQPAAVPRADCVFHLGSHDPRDRSVLVVEGYAGALRTTALPPLVIGGSLGTSMSAEVEQRALQLGVAVKLTERLTDEDLADLFRHAAVVVQPSSDEGFGLQPLEAMAAGAKLVVTQAAAVEEVVATAAVTVEATVDGLSKGILEAVSRDELREQGRTRATTFSWNATARHTLEALHDAAGRA